MTSSSGAPVTEVIDQYAVQARNGQLVTANSPESCKARWTTDDHKQAWATQTLDDAERAVSRFVTKMIEHGADPTEDHFWVVHRQVRVTYPAFEAVTP